MQTINKTSAPSQLLEIFIVIILGLSIGGMTYLFLKSLEWIELTQVNLNLEKWPPHLFAIPFVLIFLIQLKKRTLFFPTKVSELTTWSFDSQKFNIVNHWNVLMTPFHFLGTLLSHICGVSVGREGTVVLMAAGLVRIIKVPFKISWSYWGPISMAIGFGSVIGNYWIAPVFLVELFTTNLQQKIYTLIGAGVSVLLMQSLHAPHLLTNFSIQADPSFFQKLWFVLVLGITSGYMMRLYKWAYYNCTDFFKSTSIWMKLLVAVLLMFFLMQPELRKFQSLGLLQIENIQMLNANLSDSVIKLFVTLISVTLGFWGGEFIPLIYSGLHFGNYLAQIWQFDLVLGTLLATYVFFAGATRLKWTSYFLLIALLGWGWWILAYVLMSTAISFSGEKSLYQSGVL